MKIKLAGYGIGLLALFFIVSAVSRLITPTQDEHGRTVNPVTPGLVSGTANALANLFRNTIN